MNRKDLILFAVPLLLCAGSLFAATADTRSMVFEDAKAVKRVAQVAGRDLPKEVLGRIVKEDIDLLRGKRSDGTFAYAHYEREESNRESNRFAVRKDDDKKATAQIRAAWSYRLIISVPNRRLVVTRNRRTYIDHVELELTTAGGEHRTQTVPVQAWLEPGQDRKIDLPDIERDAIAKVFAHVDSGERGAATIELALLVAKLVDNADSPFFTPVSTAKQLQRAIERGDGEGARRLSGILATSLEPAEARASMRGNDMTITAPRITTPAVSETGLEAPPSVEIYLELQAVEDLMTGNDAERREGLDKLHQLIRRVRPSTR
ncbi:MAG TPA: hypothetical protein VHL58_16625 [Thermoanaerobaculia bacterium]|nr:hypothetical protein [Thermoanaerobaculia bacterium]